MKDAIKAYIEEQCQDEGNATLRTNYADSKQDIDGCCAYINNEARKYLNGQNGAIADAVVYGWAVHYFEEKIYDKKASKPAPKAEPKAKKVLPVGKEMRPVAQPVAEAKPEPKKPAANLLFDFDEL